jgi:DNA-binding response OmpR family regulator
MNRVNRVLVVDDEPTIRELIAEALRESGYEVDTAAHGAEALDLMHRNPPDAIVLDLMMPRLDGHGFVQLMRLNPRFASVPIVLVTATYGAAKVAESIGVRACVTKPFELDELVAVVHGILSESPRAPVAELGPGQTAVGSRDLKRPAANGRPTPPLLPGQGEGQRGSVAPG